MSQLTIHVLDTATGGSAKALKVEVTRQTNHDLCASAMTNANGRTDKPLLEGDDFSVGCYTLHFYVGDYFAALGYPQTHPRFLDIVRIDIGIANASENYHIPLLLTPWSYSVYRGS